MNAPLNASSQDAVSRAALQARVVQALAQHLPAHALLFQAEDTTPYECDGLTAYRQRPLVVALTETEAQVQAVLRSCHSLGVPVVARGAGTGLSGGAMPHALGVTVFSQVQQNPETRPAGAHCPCAMRCAQPGH